MAKLSEEWELTILNHIHKVIGVIIENARLAFIYSYLDTVQIGFEVRVRFIYDVEYFIRKF